jgi:hypothetical protein
MQTVIHPKAPKTAKSPNDISLFGTSADPVDALERRTGVPQKIALISLAKSDLVHYRSDFSI